MDLTFLTNRRLISIENFVHAYSKLRLRLKEGVKSAFPCSSCCGIPPPRAAWMFDTSINIIFHMEGESITKNTEHQYIIDALA